MKELPILFSTDMVQAILESRKSQTRRLVKFRNKKWRLSYEANEEGRTDLDAFGVLDKHGNLIEIEEGEPASLKELDLCPYGKPGDLLWVRESWNRLTYSQGDISFYGYKADPNHPKERKWKPSIHMPKVAARIWLQVESVRVERLKDITDSDAIAEGIESKETKLGPSYIDYETGYCNGLFDARRCFQSLWQLINGAESWQANPWVWVVSFKVLSTTGKPTEKSAITNI